MTEKRLSVTLPEDIAKALDELKQREQFRDVSYSALLQEMLQRGIAEAEKRGIL